MLNNKTGANGKIRNGSKDNFNMVKTQVKANGKKSCNVYSNGKKSNRKYVGDNDHCDSKSCKNGKNISGNAAALNMHKAKVNVKNSSGNGNWKYNNVSNGNEKKTQANGKA